jgi:hypothetical protein
MAMEGHKKAADAAAAPAAPKVFLRKNSYRMPSAAMSLKVTAATSKQAAPAAPPKNTKGSSGGTKQPGITFHASSSTAGAKLAGGSSKAGSVGSGGNRMPLATGFMPQSSKIRLRHSGSDTTTVVRFSSTGGSSRTSSAGGLKGQVLRYSTASDSSSSSADVLAVLAGQPGWCANSKRAGRQPGDLAPEIARLQAMHGEVLAEFGVLQASLRHGRRGVR